MVRAYRSKLIDGQVLLEDSDGESLTSDNLDYLFDFLLEPADGFKVAWDIDALMAPIMRLAPPDKLQGVFEDNKLKLWPYFAIYNQGKSTYIKRGSWRATIYHLAQYWPDADEPDSLDNVVGLTNQLLADLKTIGIVPSKLSSPVAMVSDLLKKFKLPNYTTIPDDVGQFAWHCCGKTWTEAIATGHFEQAFDYDIHASYPSVLANLLDHNYGQFVHGIQPPPNACYGWCHGRVTINKDVKISPIVYTDADDHLYTPTGSWDTYLTRQEVEFILAYGLGSFDIKDAWWWVPHKRVYPYQLLMLDLYGKRPQSELLNRIIKRMQTGIYGKTLQVFPEGTFGDYFNPIYGAQIESQTRLKVARFIYDNSLENHTLHIATDGILTDKQVALLKSNGMGSWRLDSSGPALVVSSGVLFYGTKKPCQLYYDEAMELIKAKPKASEWSKAIKRTMTLGDMALGFAEMGEIKTVYTGFSLPVDHDRNFERLPATGGELLTNRYDSIPLEASKLTKPNKANNLGGLRP